MAYRQDVLEQRAISTFRIKFSRVDRGPSIYSAQVFIDGEYWGFINQRRGGDYEAFLPNNRLVGSATSLRVLREQVSRYYAKANDEPAA